MGAWGLGSRGDPGTTGPTFFPPAASRQPPAGFTIIELMVVMAIIVLAAGLMTPTITDFFRNRRLEGIRGQFGSAFNSARLLAVNERVKMSLVFFREGVRIFNERDARFTEDGFSPEGSPLAGDDIWYVLGFLDSKPSTSLSPYRDWEKKLKVEAQAGARAPGAAGGERISVRALPRLTFEQDGTLVFTSGADVSTTAFQQEPPEKADLVIYQAGNTTASFIDFRPTGQMRSKSVPMESVPAKPPPPASAGGAAPPADAGAQGETQQPENPPQKQSEN